MITRGEMAGRILRYLNKTAKHPSFYGPEKINDAITEAMDALATEMFIANEGWQTKITYLDTRVNQIRVDIPPYVAMIHQVRLKAGDIYVPATYDDGSTRPQWNQAGGGAVQWAATYRIVDNALYFDPALSDGGEKYIMLEHQSYPKRLQNDASFMEAHFQPAFQHYIKYRACSILAGSIEKQSIPWRKEEEFWAVKCQELIPKRILQSTQIAEYEGC